MLFPDPLAHPGNSVGAASATSIDSQGHRLLWIYGGQQVGELQLLFTEDLWRFNFTSSIWTYMGPGEDFDGPGARWASLMVWNSVDDSLLLFGGKNDTGPFNEVWEYKIQSETFVRLADQNDTVSAEIRMSFRPSNHPAPRVASSGFYDASSGLFFIFGGATDAGQSYGDLWAFRKSDRSFALLGGETSVGYSGGDLEPGARYQSYFCHNRHSNTMYLYGGLRNCCSTTIGDLWEFSPAGNGSWTRWASTAALHYNTTNMGTPQPIINPGPRYGGAAVCDDKTDAFYLLSGTTYREPIYQGSTNAFHDIWKIDPRKSLQWSLLFEAQSRLVPDYGDKPAPGRRSFAVAALFDDPISGDLSIYSHAGLPDGDYYPAADLFFYQWHRYPSLTIEPFDSYTASGYETLQNLTSLPNSTLNIDSSAFLNVTWCADLEGALNITIPHPIPDKWSKSLFSFNYNCIEGAWRAFTAHLADGSAPCFAAGVDVASILVGEPPAYTITVSCRFPAISNIGNLTIEEDKPVVVYDFVQSSTGTLTVSPGSTLSVLNCATLNGTLQFTFTDNVPVNQSVDVLLFNEACVSGGFTQVFVTDQSPATPCGDRTVSVVTEQTSAKLTALFQVETPACGPSSAVDVPVVVGAVVGGVVGAVLLVLLIIFIVPAARARVFPFIGRDKAEQNNS